eukprot:GFUD01089858.1.p1 GENE.GFUD01089858.1~~GFUD01089858.1.p1  ORF type:complete len:241 (-),score=54.69 GFUD01089858.1:131-853(-)
MNGTRELLEDSRYRVSSFDPIVSPVVAPHTLIVGTMPGITSHGLSVYYGHASNVFWWIAGEALGFRRGGPHMEREWPDQFQTKPAKDILSGLFQVSAPILSYQDQVAQLTGAGFALWDVVKECGIKNSDDTSIRDCAPNDIKGLVERHQSITKIVFASGKTSAKLFAKLNKVWLKEGQFKLGGEEFTISTFSTKVLNQSALPGAIELVVPFSVSPAAAAVRFCAKRDQWLSAVFNVPVEL